MILQILLVVFALQSCQQKDLCADTICPSGQVCMDGTCVGSKTNVIVSSNITTNTTWTSDNIYELAGRITVENGATLTIEAGTIIKGQAGTGTNATALLVARGAKINAVGTELKPIIFTTVADEISLETIKSGNFKSPNLGNDVSGYWGGLIILGKAPISASAPEIQIEGIPTTDLNGLYGGNDSQDNSGTLKFVSIRHGGANIGNGNEINGLTLGGVGNGTTIENIEIVANQDDGIEFFGGSVNVKNLIVVNSGDDAIDTDQAWSGILENFVVVCGSATDHALEIDGPEGTMIASHTVRNGAIKGSSVAELGDFRACARGNFSDIYFFNFPDPAVDSRGDFSLTNTCTTDNLSSGFLSFSNLEVVLPTNVTLTQVFKNGTDAFASSVTSRGVTLNKTAFNFWSWSSQIDLLSDF